MFIFKIRHILTGQYSDGNSQPSWNNQGYEWKDIRDLEAHLLASRMHYLPENQFELVEFKQNSCINLAVYNDPKF